jgi:hypothetical protein
MGGWVGPGPGLNGKKRKILLDLIVVLVGMRSTSYEAAHYAVFSILLSIPPS